MDLPAAPSANIMARTILVVGTYDTKDDELFYVAQVIRAQGGQVVTMDVSVLGEPKSPPDITKHQVAGAAGSSIEQTVAARDENFAMQIMARGSATLALTLYRQGKFAGVIVLGGSMGAALALDLCAALPLGVPKYVVSTVSFSAMLPPERLAPDLQMILWAGGLYGLNSICKASLSQAAGAVLGAARTVDPPRRDRPLIVMTSFGKTVLRYMIALKPALEQRGFEVAVFHATGMGGRAFESLAAEGAFAAVLDFAPQEVGNHHFGSAISAGPDRMTAAGKRGIPQLVSVGCCDLVDLVGWQPVPDRFTTNVLHHHNRLLSSVVINTAERRQIARVLNDRLAQATGETVLLVPPHGDNEWDREGAPLHAPDAYAAFVAELTATCPPNVRQSHLDAHINDAAFTDAALLVIDDWITRSLLRP